MNTRHFSGIFRSPSDTSSRLMGSQTKSSLRESDGARDRTRKET